MVFLQKSSKPQQFSMEATKNLLVCFLWVLKNMDSQVLKDWWADQPSSRFVLVYELEDVFVGLSQPRFAVAEFFCVGRLFLPCEGHPAYHTYSYSAYKTFPTLDRNILH